MVLRALMAPVGAVLLLVAFVPSSGPPGVEAVWSGVGGHETSAVLDNGVVVVTLRDPEPTLAVQDVENASRRFDLALTRLLEVDPDTGEVVAVFPLQGVRWAVERDRDAPRRALTLERTADIEVETDPVLGIPIIPDDLPLESPRQAAVDVALSLRPPAAAADPETGRTSRDLSVALTVHRWDWVDESDHLVLEFTTTGSVDGDGLTLSSEGIAVGRLVWEPEAAVDAGQRAAVTHGGDGEWHRLTYGASGFRSLQHETAAGVLEPPPAPLTEAVALPGADEPVEGQGLPTAPAPSGIGVFAVLRKALELGLFLGFLTFMTLIVAGGVLARRDDRRRR